MKRIGKLKQSVMKEPPFRAKADLGQGKISTQRIESIRGYGRLGFGVGTKDPFGRREGKRGGFIISEHFGRKGVP